MNPENKHTPAPWHIDSVKSDDGFYSSSLIRGEFGTVIASVNLGLSGTESPILQANASVIAAAPELLAALEDMLWHMPEGEEKQGASWVKAARLAIARARGQG